MMPSCAHAARSNDIRSRSSRSGGAQGSSGTTRLRDGEHDPQQHEQAVQLLALLRTVNKDHEKLQNQIAALRQRVLHSRTSTQSHAVTARASRTATNTLLTDPQRT